MTICTNTSSALKIPQYTFSFHCCLDLRDGNSKHTYQRQTFKKSQINDFMALISHIKSNDYTHKQSIVVHEIFS